MKRLWFTLLLLSLPVQTWAQDDWSVTRSAFDPRIVNRYKAILAAKPSDRYALSKLLRLYKRHRSVGQLIKEFRRKVAASPKRLKLHLALANILRAAGRKAEALKVYQQALKLRPNSASLHAAIAKIYQRSGKPKEAKANFTKALALAKRKRAKIAYLRALADIAFAERDVAAALAYYKRLLALAPRDRRLRERYASALSKAKQFDKAIAIYRQLLRKTRDTATRATMLKEIGSLLHRSKKPAQAIATYRKAMRLATSGSWIRRELIDRVIAIHREQDDLKGLIVHYEKTWKRRGHFEWKTLGRLYEETGAEGRAIKAFRSALKRSPYEIDTRTKLILLLERSGKAKEVLAQYRTLARLAPGEPRFQIELAKRLYAAGKKKQAIAVLSACGRRFARDAAVHSTLADLYSRWGQEKRAMAEAKLLIRIEPREDSHLVDLGEQYWVAGKKRKAVATWKRILRVTPKRHKAYAKLAGIYAQHKMSKEAIDLYRKALKLKPNWLPYHRSLALLLQRNRATRKALDAWHKVLALARKQKAGQTVSEAITQIVEVLHRSYLLRTYLRGYRRTFHSSNPLDVDTGFLLAEAERKRGNLKEAAKIYRKIIAAKPKNMTALLALERVLRDQRKFADAVTLLKKMAKLDPSRAAEFYQRIANLLLLLYNDDEALVYAHRAIAHGKKNPRSYVRLAELYEQKNDLPQAIAAYKQAIKLDPRLFPAQFALAQLYARIGKFSEADPIYRDILSRANQPEVLRRAFHLGIPLATYLDRHEVWERALLKLAVSHHAQSKTFRRLLVRLYRQQIPTLIEQLESGNSKRAHKAHATLRRIGLRGIAPLLEALGTSTGINSDRLELINMLGYLQNTNAAEPLMRIASEQVKRQPIVIYARQSRPYRSSLKRYGSVRLTRPTEQRVTAIIAAGRLGAASAAAPLNVLSRNADRHIRKAATWALGRLVDKKARAGLLGRLADSSADVQMTSCLGLGNQRDPKLAPILLEVSGDLDRDARVRVACIWSLGAIHTKTALDGLIGLLDAPEPTIAFAAALALGRQPSQRALHQILKRMWTEPSRKSAYAQALEVRHLLARGQRLPTLTPWDLLSHGGWRFVNRLRGEARLIPPSGNAWRQLEKQGATGVAAAGLNLALRANRDTALGALADLTRYPKSLSLGRLGPSRPPQQWSALTKSLAPQLIGGLSHAAKHRAPLVRQQALIALLRVGSATAAQKVVAFLDKETSAEVRAPALRELTHWTKQASSAGLNRLIERSLTAKSWTERAAAAQLMARQSTVPERWIAKGLTDASGFVREAVVAGIRGDLAEKYLAKALADPVAEVQLAACRQAIVLKLQDDLSDALKPLLKSVNAPARGCAKKALNQGK